MSELSYLIGRLWHHIGSHRRKQMCITAVLMILSATMEVLSLGAVVPFLGFLAAPEVVLENSFVQSVVSFFSVAPKDFVLFFTLLFIVAALSAGAMRMTLLWVMTRVAYSTGSDISVELYRKTLYQPYSVHVSRNTSTVLSGIGKVNGAMSILSQCLTLTSSTIFLLAIITALILIDPVITLISMVGFSCAYVLIALYSRRKLSLNGKKIANNQTQVFKVLQEGLGGIRDVLLDGTQSLYVKIYQQSDRPLRRAQGDNVFIAGSPRFAMESLGMALIAVLAYYLSADTNNFTYILPTLGALALGAQRLLPVLQQGYSAWAIILGAKASLSDIIEILDQPVNEAALLSHAPPLDFKEQLSFSNVYFRYSDDSEWVIKNLNLSIPKGSRVGLVGTTGSGKSTVLDMLMGLLEPTKGEFLVDGKQILPADIQSWQRGIAHVPQSIYLSDASFTENIAFGIPPEDINHERVRSAAEQAQIAEYIEGYPQGYDATVGERGIQLSGGQRQRVGIARALYKQANVLFLDEATSALDNATELSLMKEIELLDSDLTIFFIAHRLTTVRHCDILIELKEGEVHAIGDYESLLETSESFRKLAGEL